MPGTALLSNSAYSERTSWRPEHFSHPRLLHKAPCMQWRRGRDLSATGCRAEFTTCTSLVARVDSPVWPAQCDHVREAFAHGALLGMDPDADTRAPGAAITKALCGHWTHEPPCPVTRTITMPNGSTLRTLFVAEPHMEPEARQRIEAALSSGHLRGTHGVATRWQLLSNEPSAVSARERHTPTVSTRAEPCGRP